LTCAFGHRSFPSLFATPSPQQARMDYLARPPEKSRRRAPPPAPRAKTRRRPRRRLYCRQRLKLTPRQ
jgi:hypothetical protein